MSMRAAQRPGHRATTRHAQAIYPFIAPGGFAGRGVFIGRDAAGGAFCFDPWALYSEGLLDDEVLTPITALGACGATVTALVVVLVAPSESVTVRVTV